MTMMLEINDTTTTPSLQPSQADAVPFYLKVLASLFYNVSMVMGIGGNILVLLVVLYYQRTSKTVTSFFIINLAISDLIFAILCIPSTYITAYLIQHWPFHSFLCIFFNYMQMVSVMQTVYTLVWMTLDKYWSFVRPFRARMSIGVCKCLIVGSWLISGLISLPIALFTKLIQVSSGGGGVDTTDAVVFVDDPSSSNASHNHYNQSISELNTVATASSSMFVVEQQPQCVEQWPDNYAKPAQIYNISLLVVQYFAPLIILTYWYIRISIVLRRSKAPGESMERRDAKIIKSKQQLLMMVFLMNLTFMIFWAPLQFLNVYRFYDETIAHWPHFVDLFFVCHILAVSRSFVNPIIYTCTNSKYREGFAHFLCCCCMPLSANARSGSAAAMVGAAPISTASAQALRRPNNQIFQHQRSAQKRYEQPHKQSNRDDHHNNQQQQHERDKLNPQMHKSAAAVVAEQINHEQSHQESSPPLSQSHHQQQITPLL